MGRKGGGVPDRWEDYSNIGTLVEGTSFLAFKVPLKAALLAQVSLVWINRSRTAYDSIATVGEIRVYRRADFQSGSRVLKKVF